MSRPSARILLSDQDLDSQIDILAADKIWAVYYKNQPFNYRRRYFNTVSGVVKYCRTNFTNMSPAYVLCDKLNSLFDCEDFTVVEIE